MLICRQLSSLYTSFVPNTAISIRLSLHLCVNNRSFCAKNTKKINKILNIPTKLCFGFLCGDASSYTAPLRCICIYIYVCMYMCDWGVAHSSKNMKSQLMHTKAINKFGIFRLVYFALFYAFYFHFEFYFLYFLLSFYTRIKVY